MGTSLKKVAKKAKDYKYVLMVMRHAKTEPFGNGGDAGRELTDKGRKQAKSVAKGLASFKLVPDRIACSSATRARQTCDRMLKVFGDDPKVDYRQSLYEGGVQSVFDELAQTKEKRRTLLILGHEPTVSIACQWIASSESDPTLLDLLNLGMSPASIAVFGADEPFNQWQLHSGNGSLTALLGQYFTADTALHVACLFVQETGKPSWKNPRSPERHGFRDITVRKSSMFGGEADI